MPVCSKTRSFITVSFCICIQCIVSQSGNMVFAGSDIRQSDNGVSTRLLVFMALSNIKSLAFSLQV